MRCCSTSVFDECIMRTWRSGNALFDLARMGSKTRRHANSVFDKCIMRAWRCENALFDVARMGSKRQVANMAAGRAKRGVVREYEGGARAAGVPNARRGVVRVYGMRIGRVGNKETFTGVPSAWCVMFHGAR